MKKVLTTISLAAMMAIPAVAQETAPAPTQMPAENQATRDVTTVAKTGMVSASDLMNKSVRNANNEAVGDINDLQIDADGKIAAVIVGVGGFLGLGEKDVGLPYDQLTFARDGDGSLIITANVTKESLQSAPAWNKADRM